MQPGLALCRVVRFFRNRPIICWIALAFATFGMILSVVVLADGQWWDGILTGVSSAALATLAVAALIVTRGGKEL